jgi:hypothetical protein
MAERSQCSVAWDNAVFRVTTKKVGDRSKEILVKWNRMGQDIPGETAVADEAGAEFNSQCGQNTQPTSKLPESPEFTSASRINLGRRSVSR